MDIARDVKALCPEAWFFNYSNPMTANCWAIRKATSVPVVGLCHGTFHVERQLAEFIGAPPEEVTSLFVGLNHLTFIFDLRWRGRDAWPLVRARLDEEGGQSFDFDASSVERLGVAGQALPRDGGTGQWGLQSRRQSLLLVPLRGLRADVVCPRLPDG